MIITLSWVIKELWRRLLVPTTDIISLKSVFEKGGANKPKQLMWSILKCSMLDAAIARKMCEKYIDFD